MAEAGHAGDNGVDGGLAEGMMLAGAIERGRERTGDIADARWVAAWLKAGLPTAAVEA